MKVNKYIIGMFVATATLFVSCNTDNEGDIYNGTTMEGEDFATWEVEVQKADQISWYKAMNLYEKGYNIVFKVNEANEVTVESQPAWKHASYGEVFVSGKGALEDGVITVKLSHDVPNVGGFGEFKEILYLPAK